MTENKLKHLEFIQNVITRMNANSFMIKGWMATLVSALLALAAKDADLRFLIIAFFPIPFFWVLDAYYLSQERQYRDLYDSVRVKTEGQIDFSMNASGFNKDKNTWFNTFRSKTLKWFYGPIAALVCLIIVFIKCMPIGKGS